MQDFINQIARMLYPDMSDQEIMAAIRQVKQESPNQPDEMIVLGMINDYVNDDSEDEDN